MQRLPLDISSFQSMIEDEYLYVDKTKQIYNLLTSGSRLFFLSRPRRFGKSLLISTLKHLFKDDKKLFESLWIGSSDYEWVEYPVINLDFSILDSSSAEKFEISLARNLDEIGRSYDLDLTSETLLGFKLIKLVKELSKKNKVVILIDEYDHPLIKNLNNIDEAQKRRDILTHFCTVLKNLNPHLHALFLTGVTKFAKTSIFSGLNNLNDISLDPLASDLLGYTEDEISIYFKPYIEVYAKTKQSTYDDVSGVMREWYNGYRFSSAPTKVYNPFSIQYFLHKKQLKNYWLESGTPSFLITVLKKQLGYLQDFQDVELSSESLGAVEIDDIPIITMLFQTGYLTIADFNEKNGTYKLDYPNEEVRISFQKYLLSAFSERNIQAIESTLSKLKRSLEKYDIPQFCQLLQSLFAHVPYQLHIGQEKYYHSIFQLLASLISLDGTSEESTDKGRIDLVIKTENYIYIIELKIDASPDAALKQILDKRYFEKYLVDKRKIIALGVSFNKENDGVILSCTSQVVEK